MEIIDDLNILNIIEIISKTAKYQKVMLLYDETVSNTSIIDMYKNIRHLCIFNKMNMKDIDMNELNNGYKLIIYMCGAESFLALTFDRREFVNLIIPTDKYFVPYLIYDNKINKYSNDYLVLKSKVIDEDIISSIYFNRFYTCINNLLCLDESSIEYNEISPNISYGYNKQELLQLCEDLTFVDIEIIKHEQIEYKYLQILDVILIDMFLLIIESVKNNTLTIVDIYKATKNDYSLIDKFYAMINNDIIRNLINLNYGYIVEQCRKSREKIVNNINYNLIDNNKVQEIIDKIKNYTKKTDNIMSYFYLYNMFGV